MKSQDTWREAEKADALWKGRLADLLSGAEIPGSPELVAWSRKFGWVNGFEPLDRVHDDGTSTSGWVGTASKGRYRLSEKAREVVNGELVGTGPEQNPSTETTPETGEVERFSTLHLLCREAATAVDKVHCGLNRLENRVTEDVEARIRAQEEQKKLQAELEGITQEHVALLEKYKDLQSRYEVLTSAAKGFADVHSHFRRQTLKVGWLCKRLLRQIFGPVTYLENDDAEHHS